MHRSLCWQVRHRFSTDAPTGATPVPHSLLRQAPGSVARHCERPARAMMSLCEQISALNMTLPETDFRRRFHVRLRPGNGQE